MRGIQHPLGHRCILHPPFSSPRGGGGLRSLAQPRSSRRLPAASVAPPRQRHKGRRSPPPPRRPGRCRCGAPRPDRERGAFLSISSTRSRTAFENGTHSDFGIVSGWSAPRELPFVDTSGSCYCSCLAVPSQFIWGGFQWRAKPVATFTTGSLPLNFAPKPVATDFATGSLLIEISPRTLMATKLR